MPLVSVIMATYNRSNVLVYAIDSVRAQTHTNWELIVVGDACTDDTEAVVTALNDPRIRFINLPKNVGEQSGPNNVGLREAQGTYLAFLNHDDLWFPDHLATALALFAQQPDTDFLLSMGVILNPDHFTYVAGLFQGDCYKPNYFVPASGWVFHQRVLAAAGHWRSYKQLWVYPSHDYLRRVYRAGLTMRPSNRLTWVAIPSGNRTNSYRDRQSDEHAYYANQLATNPNWRSDLLTSALLSAETDRQGGVAMVWQGVKNIIKQPLVQRGIATVEWRFMLTSLRKGHALRQLRQVRGLSDFSD